MTTTEKEKKPAAVAEEVKKTEEAKSPAQTAKEQAESSLRSNFEPIIKAIESMNILELSELVKTLEDRFGISAAMPVMAGAPAASGGAPQPAVEEKTEFTCILSQVGEKKIQVIKEVRAITGLGLKEAKALVDGAPKPVKENVPKEEAEEIKKKLEAVGATVEIK
jgi:large subunit ribosomal protein L7/L12